MFSLLDKKRSLTSKKDLKFKVSGVCVQSMCVKIHSAQVLQRLQNAGRLNW